MSLTNEQYSQIEQIYDERQRQDRAEEQKRLQTVTRKVPEIGRINDEIASVSVSRAKLLLDGRADALSGLHEKLKSLSLKKRSLLSANGFPADYLDPVYSCPDCKDTGYIGNEKCHCFRQLAIGFLYQQSNLHLNVEGEDFEHFDLNLYDEEEMDPARGISSRASAAAALEECLKFTRTFSSEFQNILLYGDVGTGKTFLTHCIAKELMQQGFSILYFGAENLFEVLSDQAFRRQDSSPEDYQLITDCDLLIIDDLGTEYANTFTVSRLFSLLNDRLLRQKSTVISTNLSLEQIEDRYTERTASRIISAYTMIKMFGKDIRVEKKLLKFTVAHS